MDSEQRQQALALIQQALPDLDWTLQSPKVKRLSRDFHWFSPVLKRQLEDKQADAVVRPRSEEELSLLVQACVKHQLPLILRGGATGNYGQLVPLEGGILVDMTGFDQICELGNGVVRAQAGIRLSAIETLTRPAGWELRCMPSTYRLASLGGLYGGGFGGIGSINYGPLGAPGNVLSVKVMTMEAEPRILHVPAPQALLLHHAYGSNGIVLEVELALAPVHSWTERLDVFDDFTDALDYANAIARSPGLVKRQLALFAAPIPSYFSHLNGHYQASQHAVISVIAQESEGFCAGLLEKYRGHSAVRQSADVAREANASLMEYCWNHTTLHALKIDSSLTYLQTAFNHANYRQQIIDMAALLGDEVISHIEFLRDNDGNITASGLQLVRYSTEERLNEIMNIFRDNGVKINNPHVYHIEDGKQGEIKPDVVSVKKCLDPGGLLNPGKLRGWEVRDSLVLDNNPLLLRD
ncbi:FAD/FMN-containing dehydrogenase [Rahnella aquatilis CIP 78.65 = ATCC 33071]|uniref:FAD/FMN-dependent dehydrogenase n=1 Tax=Rahnella aquatilis (strain ATCC 33071 / DSM 4594 / JCM 1683 / NBRC 105701 / NCIMB 13365 / CIP 78.65) TaxID=745277 RepID=H2IVK6_RAHAC|nr:FAD-binding oxidoreductase [Rahnella aquatilis]AEX51793.1 FAD/FMN-dependent dehydrogenase [Rahnella aquatilis CIP 78.65 = ATCC 33071]KFD15920.1 FAD/FMN-containing dehydrogenase [Rahnella aquatilis CIP 78.65 = ATCC 33071]